MCTTFCTCSLCTCTCNRTVHSALQSHLQSHCSLCNHTCNHTCSLCNRTCSLCNHTCNSTVHSVIAPAIAPVHSVITFALARLTYKLLTTSLPAYLCLLMHYYKPSCIQLVNSASITLDSLQNFVKDLLVTWLLYSYLLK